MNKLNQVKTRNKCTIYGCANQTTSLFVYPLHLFNPSIASCASCWFNQILRCINALSHHSHNTSINRFHLERRASESGSNFFKGLIIQSACQTVVAFSSFFVISLLGFVLTIIKEIIWTFSQIYLRWEILFCTVRHFLLSFNYQPVHAITTYSSNFTIA